MKRRSFIKAIIGTIAAVKAPELLAEPEDELNSLFIAPKSDHFEQLMGNMNFNDYQKKQKALNVTRRQIADNLKLSSSIDCFYLPPNKRLS